MKDKLYIIIPAYNEEENIQEVVKQWHEVVEKIGNDSKIVVINDGSKDQTLEKVNSLKYELKALEVLDKENGGHGDSVLYGYKYALEKQADYIFQTDSDGQTLASEFWKFWEKREQYGAMIGHRDTREDGMARVFVTKVLKFVLFLIFGLNIPDANTPFRLMKYEVLAKYYPMIPEHFNLANVMLTVLLVKNKEQVKFEHITFRPRQGGVNSINFKKIAKIGTQAIKDFLRIKKELKMQDITKESSLG